VNFDVRLLLLSEWLMYVVGYRDAQVGWTEVTEDSPVTTEARHALFLVIYVPRRGLLEVCWFS